MYNEDVTYLALRVNISDKVADFVQTFDCDRFIDADTGENKHLHSCNMTEQTLIQGDKIKKMPENTNILAAYRDYPGQPAAIVQCIVGKGVAVLTGVHPEYDPTKLPADDPYLTKRSIIQKLIQDTPTRTLCFQAMLRILRLCTRRKLGGGITQLSSL